MHRLKRGVQLRGLLSLILPRLIVSHSFLIVTGYNVGGTTIRSTRIVDGVIENVEKIYHNGVETIILESWGWGKEKTRKVWINGVLQR
jgi:hypothetical protein